MNNLKRLETALLINEKMRRRLKTLVEVRREERASAEPTLLDLLDKLDDDQ